MGALSGGASLVPAAVVIPASIMYIQVVAVKKLVIRLKDAPASPPNLTIRFFCSRSFQLISSFTLNIGYVNHPLINFERLNTSAFTNSDKKNAWRVV